MIYLRTYLIIALISWIILSAISWKNWRTLIGTFFFAAAWPTAHILYFLMWWHSARCAWCGKETRKDEAAIQAHILECEKHPFRPKLEELQRYRELLGIEEE